MILSNSSVHQIIPKPDFVAYSLSKGAMGNMTRTLALEYADRGIRVNAVDPAPSLRLSIRRGKTIRKRAPAWSRIFHGTLGRIGRDRFGVCVPCFGRSLVYHGSNDLRLRRADAVSRVPDQLVIVGNWRGFSVQTGTQIPAP